MKCGLPALLMVFLLSSGLCCLSQMPGVTILAVDSGWAKNSINTVVFRKNSITSFKGEQYIAYYNSQAYVVVGKRKLGSATWQLKQMPFKGKVVDAHNTISIAVDGSGYIHLAWDHHNDSLHYIKSVSPGSLVFTNKQSMTGQLELRLSYPEFYHLPNGNLLFLYRDGSSGSGNLVMNQYNHHTKKWIQLQHNLIDGEGARNAYWQSCIDAKGTIHISWVWRESPNVASNHDMGYACSADGGITWKKSTDEVYQLPITASSAEYAAIIPQASELINQTAMSATPEGQPVIATYWRDSGTTVPQYHIIYKTGERWQVQNLGFRKTAFSLGGAGTKRIPVARPQVLVWKKNTNIQAAIIFRDEERGNKISMAINHNLQQNNWKVVDTYNEDVGSWEPSYDTELWKQKGLLDLFVQKTEQTDAEGVSRLPPQMIYVIQCKPSIIK